MEFQNYFPIWNKLSPEQQNQILGSLISRKVEKRTVVHNGGNDCTGGVPQMPSFHGNRCASFGYRSVRAAFLKKT